MATAQGPDGKEQPANGHWLIIGKYHGDDCWIIYDFVNMPGATAVPAPEGGCGHDVSRTLPISGHALPTVIATLCG